MRIWLAKLRDHSASELKKRCKEHGREHRQEATRYRGYSKKKRSQLIELLMRAWDIEQCRAAIEAHSKHASGEVAIKWHSFWGGDLHFLGALSSGSYCVYTTVGENTIWYEGDLDSALAHLPREPFEQATRAI
jgi:hypothetical protein